MKERTKALSTGRFRLFQVALVSCSLLLASVAIMGLILGDLAGEYPDAPAWLLQGFVTIPTLGSVIGNALCGAFANKIGKKNLCIFSLILVLFGGIVPMIIPSLVGKIIIRIFAALGTGFLQPLSGAIIIDCFEDKTAKTIMGIQGSFVGLGATLFSATIAAIMSVNWHYAYFSYLYAVPVLILVFFGVPAFINEQAGAEQGKNGPQSASASKLPASAYFVMIISFAYSLGYMALMTCISMAAVEVGTISTVQAASITSVAGIAGLVGGFLFGVITGALGLKKVGTVGAIFTFVGLLLIGATANLALWYIGACLINVGFGWWMPFISFLITEGTDASTTAKATGLGYMGYSAGNFLFSWVLAAVGVLFGGIGNHGAFIFGAVCVAIAIVLLMGYFATAKKRNTQTT